MTLKVIEQLSTLRTNKRRELYVNLQQLNAGRSLVGIRDAFERAQDAGGATGNEQTVYKRHLKSARRGDLVVLSFHPGVQACAKEFKAFSNKRTVVALAGVKKKHNTTWIGASGKLLKQNKLSLSSEDIDQGVIPGETLHVFAASGADDRGVSWAALNCHDYSNADILRHLLDKKLHLLVVVAHNNAQRLFWEYAVSDIHRLFCFVVIVNVAEIGGSGVFAPFRRLGKTGEHAQFGAAGQVFGARGPSEVKALIKLDIGALRDLRCDFETHGVKIKEFPRDFEPVLPSEHFTRTPERKAGPPPLPDGVKDELLPWSDRQTGARIAVAQLRSMPIDAYLSTTYRIRNHADVAAFTKALDRRLDLLAHDLRDRGETAEGKLLDLLVFPEVFIPRSYLGALQTFADKTGALVVAGVDYPDGDEDTNANEFCVLRPGGANQYFRKVTRSQYDAIAANGEDLMPLNCGGSLHRFVTAKGDIGLGILICYDFSHFDLMHQINLARRQLPLDVLIVVAHNPFGALYRTCCLADAHRFYQYVVMCNVSQYGGSGVFAPMRTTGPRQTLLDFGAGVEAIGITDLDLDALRKARNKRDQDLHKGPFMRRPGVFQRRLS